MALLRFLCNIGELRKPEADALRRGAESRWRHQVDSVCERIGEERLARLLSEHLELPLVDLTTAEIEPGVTQRISQEMATRYDAFPIRDLGRSVLVAMVNPLDAEGVKAIEFAGRFKVRTAVATRGQVREAIRRAYILHEELSGGLLASSAERRVELVDPGVRHAAPEPSQGVEEAAAAERAVDALLAEGLRLGATDIQIEPTESCLAVRHRISGSFERGATIPRAMQAAVVARIKAMASLDAGESCRPQEGCIRVRGEERTADVRVACIPTPLGEKLVLGLLEPDAAAHPLTATGLGAEGVDQVRLAAGALRGLILLSGSTGSGKSTTAHAILRELVRPGRSIVTIERKIEGRLAGGTEIEVDERQGQSFVGALRGALDPAPDVVFVGELPDGATARLAVDAAASGRLVLAILPADDATSCVTRLLELGCEPQALAAALRLIVAQRLVRRVCRSCQRYERASDLVRARFGRHGEKVTSVAAGAGCEKCRRTGFAGRTGIFEVLPISAALRVMIEQGADEGALRAKARAEGVRSLLAAGIDAVAAGRTTFEELERVVPPCAEAEAAPSAPGLAGETGRPDAGAPDEYRILVVDDDPGILAMLRHALRSLPLPSRVLTASSGPEALAVLERESAHFAILDVTMDGMSGLELCERIRMQERHAAIPIFMLTAREQLEFKAHAFRAGADDYLIKPVTRTELVARVQRALERTYGVHAMPVAVPEVDDPQGASSS